MRAEIVMAQRDYQRQKPYHKFVLRTLCMVTLTVARGLLFGDGGEVIRVGRTRFTRLSEAESDVIFHPSVLTKNKLLVHTSSGPYLWAHIQISPSVLHGSLRTTRRVSCKIGTRT